MPFVAQLTDDAGDALEEIVDYFSRKDAPGRNEHVLERIEQAFQALGAPSIIFPPFAGAWLKGMAG